VSMRLHLAGRWLPFPVKAWILGRMGRVTNAALDTVLAEHAPEELRRIQSSEGRLPRGIAARRARIAQGHTRRILALTDALGEERAVELARTAMLPVGLTLAAG